MPIRMEARDWDGDRVPEILVCTRAPRCEVCWLFALAADGLPKLISPDSDSEDGAMVEPIFVDLDGDGDDDVINQFHGEWTEGDEVRWARS